MGDSAGFYAGAAAIDCTRTQFNLASKSLAHLTKPGAKKLIYAEKGVDAGALPLVNFENQLIRASSPKVETKVDFKRGDECYTGVETDFAIEDAGENKGKHFFVVKGPHGEELYTHGGRFKFVKDILVDEQGQEVHGDNGAIKRLPNQGPIYVSGRGEVSQNGVKTNKLGIAFIPNPDELIPFQGSDAYFVIREGSAMTPQPGKEYSINQGSYEESNSSIMDASMQMMEATYHNTLFSKIIKVYQSVNQQTIENIGGT